MIQPYFVLKIINESKLLQLVSARVQRRLAPTVF